MDFQSLPWTAGALVLIRVAVALRLTPFLGGRPLPWLAWAGLSVAVTLALWPVFASPDQASEVVGSSLLLAGLREALVGASLGLAARLAFAVLQSAGALLSAAVLTYPGSGTEPEGGALGPSVSGFFVLFGTAAFLLVDGHHALIGALAGSLRCLPVGVGGPIATGLGQLMEAGLALFSGAFAWAVMVAAPVYVAGLVADFTVALVSRAVPVVGQPGSAGVLRALVTELALIAVLAAAVTATVGFLQDGLTGLPVCGG